MSDLASASSVKSAERVLSIFEYFDKQLTPRTLSEISQDLQFPVSSTLALLRSIQGLGYLDYSFENKTYFPSSRFALLGQRIFDRLFESGAVIQMMGQLAARTGETILLGAQNGLQSQHVHIIPASQPLSYHPATGTLRPILRSAVGRVLLSNQPRSVVIKVVKRVNITGIDDQRSFKVADVLADLDTVRADGFAYSANVFTAGAGIVSVALPHAPGAVAMTISVGGPANRISESALPGLLKQIHQAIQEYL